MAHVACKAFVPNKRATATRYASTATQYRASIRRILGEGREEERGGRQYCNTLQYSQYDVLSMLPRMLSEYAIYWEHLWGWVPSRVRVVADLFPDDCKKEDAATSI